MATAAAELFLLGQKIVRARAVLAALQKGLVEAHGGTVTGMSEGRGKAVGSS
ncbi:hypothetical protein [Pseudomonas fluorescens]|uniref:hypothetical protein n=1 Tax=Pseudomonas fluorescens TaxID=294 RepID=UPI000B0BD999|nr:hypothetical protein [Pseudomonas fluorescens]